MHGWYKDDNASVRQNLETNSIAQLTPLITIIIQQGMREGLLKPAFPQQAAEIMLNLLMNLGNSLKKFLLAYEIADKDQENLQVTFAAYTDTIEHVLGAASGSLNLLDATMVQGWSIGQAHTMSENLA